MSLAVAALPTGAWALTPAEALSTGQREPSSAEIARRDRDCPLPVGPALAHVGTRERPTPVLRLPGIQFLAILVYKRGADGQEAISKMIDLPRGGIAGADFCDAVEIVAVPSRDLRDAVLGIIALRLRPGLDGPTDYPAAWPEAVRRNQIRTAPSGCYAVTAFRSDGDEAGWTEAVRALPAAIAGGFGFKHGGKGYLPVDCP